MTKQPVTVGAWSTSRSLPLAQELLQAAGHGSWLSWFKLVQCGGAYAMWGWGSGERAHVAWWGSQLSMVGRAHTSCNSRGAEGFTCPRGAFMVRWGLRLLGCSGSQWWASCASQVWVSCDFTSWASSIYIFFFCIFLLTTHKQIHYIFNHTFIFYVHIKNQYSPFPYL